LKFVHEVVSPVCQEVGIPLSAFLAVKTPVLRATVIYGTASKEAMN
jgi:hypothetical protein